MAGLSLERRNWASKCDSCSVLGEHNSAQCIPLQIEFRMPQLGGFWTSLPCLPAFLQRGDRYLLAIGILPTKHFDHRHNGILGGNRPPILLRIYTVGLDHKIGELFDLIYGTPPTIPIRAVNSADTPFTHSLVLLSRSRLQRQAKFQASEPIALPRLA